MADVEITNVAKLDDFNALMKTRSATLSTDMSELRVQFSNKSDGSEGQAIDAYIANLKSFEDALYDQFPQAISNFGKVFETYSDTITGAGFSAEDEVRTDAADVSEYKAKMTDEGSDQKNEVKKRTNVVKSVLKAVAAEVSSFEDPSQTIEAIKEYLDSDLDSLATNVTGTHDDLTSAKSSFISGLSAFDSELAVLDGVMEKVLAISDPNSGFSPKNVAKMILSDDLRAETVTSAMSAITSVADSQAVQRHLTGDYEAFFGKGKPDEISPTAYNFIVSNITENLLSDDKATVKKMEKRLTTAMFYLSQNKNTQVAFAAQLIAAGERYGTSAAEIGALLKNEGKDYSNQEEITFAVPHLNLLWASAISVENTAARTDLGSTVSNFSIGSYSTTMGYADNAREYVLETRVIDLTFSRELDETGRMKGFTFNLETTLFNKSAYEHMVRYKNNLNEGHKVNKSDYIEMVGRTKNGFETQKVILQSKVDAKDTSKLGELSKKVAEVRQEAIAKIIKEGVSLIPYGDKVVTGVEFLQAASGSERTASLGSLTPSEVMGKNMEGAKAGMSVLSHIQESLERTSAIYKEIEDLRTESYHNFFGFEGYKLTGSDGNSAIVYQDNPADIDAIARIRKMDEIGIRDYVNQHYASSDWKGHAPSPSEYILKEVQKNKELSADTKKAIEYLLDPNKSNLTIENIDYEAFSYARAEIEEIGGFKGDATYHDIGKIER